MKNLTAEEPDTAALLRQAVETVEAAAAHVGPDFISATTDNGFPAKRYVLDTKDESSLPRLIEEFGQLLARTILPEATLRWRTRPHITRFNDQIFVSARFALEPPP